MPKIGLLFPGQGSQAVGMGKELAESSARAKAIFDQADQILGFSLSRLMWEGPEEDLKQTENAQPAILTASLAAYAALIENGRPEPQAAVYAGHSLGEYSALCAAGALDFSSCLRLVRRRGQLMQKAAQEASGSMAAVLGKSEQEIKALFQEAGLAEDLQPANLNCPGQIVISGLQTALESFYTLARSRNIKVMPLAVSGPFHSRFMQSAAEALSADLAAAPFKNSLSPVIANVSAEPVTEVAVIRDSLLRQVTGSVRWEQSMQKMLDLGVDRMLEIGPGKILRGLMKKINATMPVANVFLPAEIKEASGQLGVLS